MDPTYRTSELAQAAGVGVQTLRYYERRGLLHEPKRSPAGHRQYDVEHLRRVTFIRKAQALGFQLEEIGHLLGMRVVHGQSCDDVSRAADQVIDRIDEKVAQLRAMRASLANLRTACEHAKPTSHCPILDALEED